MSGLSIVSGDGGTHALRVISTSGIVTLGGTTTGDAKIAVQMGAGGSLALNGTTTLYGQLLATSITTGRTVTITHRPLLTAGVSVG